MCVYLSIHEGSTDRHPLSNEVAETDIRLQSTKLYPEMIAAPKLPFGPDSTTLYFSLAAAAYPIAVTVVFV